MALTTVHRSGAHSRAVCSQNCTHGSVGGSWKSAAHELGQLAGCLPYVVDGNRDLDDPTDRTQAGLFTRPATLAGPEVRAITGGVTGDERHNSSVSARRM